MNIAQINVGTILYDQEDTKMLGFTKNLDRINILAESHKGFIWRLKDESGNATEIQVYDHPRALLNMSVWRSVEDLIDFAYQTEHVEFVKRRHEWFEKPKGAFSCLWPVQAGHFPTALEGKEKLDLYTKNGSSAEVFDFRTWKKFIP